MTETNGTALAVVEAPPPVAASVFGTDDTDEIMVRAARVAHAVQALVQSKGFASNIGGRDHVNVEGWNGLGSILGLGVRVDFCRPFTDSAGAGGYEAAVSIVTRDGAVVGGAQAICTRSERTWRTRDDYAIYSMAQTRATGKAYRSSLSWLMKMAGFEATPVEEMPEPAAPPRTVLDVAVDLGVAVETIRAWWTRDGAAWDDKAAATLVRMTPQQLARAGDAIAAWREARIVADADAMVASGEASDEDAPPKRGRQRKADPVPALDLTTPDEAIHDVEVIDPVDEEIAQHGAAPLPGGGPAWNADDDDSIPF